MPRMSSGEKMLEIRFSVPQKLHEDWIDIADAMGMSPSHADRYVWLLGVAVAFSQTNERLAAMKLQAELDDCEDFEGDD